MARTAKKSAKNIGFAPLEDRVVILPTDAETVSAGGIVLPDNAQEKPVHGRVVAVGPGKLSRNGERLPMPVSKGDQVIYGKYAGNEIELDGQEFKVLRADEILAKIEG